MFVETGSNQYLEHDTSALPGGAKPMNPDNPVPGSLRDLIGVELPPDDVLDDIVRSFFLSVDWFMMVRFSDMLRIRISSSSSLDLTQLLGLSRRIVQTQI